MAQTWDFVWETEETEADLEFSAQGECRALPGCLDRREESLSPQPETRWVCPETLCEAWKGSRVSTGSPPGSLGGI